MRLPPGVVDVDDGSAVAILIVALLLLIGATVYLRWNRYIRKSSARVALIAFSVVLAGLVIWNFSHPYWALGTVKPR